MTQQTTSIRILEKDNNRRGDLFGRLMADLFVALGYEQPRLNVHKSGRELDLVANHRFELRRAIAECNASTEPIGGRDINAFVGLIDAERRAQVVPRSASRTDLPSPHDLPDPPVHEQHFGVSIGAVDADRKPEVAGGQGPAPLTTPSDDTSRELVIADRTEIDEVDQPKSVIRTDPPLWEEHDERQTAGYYISLA